MEVSVDYSLVVSKYWMEYMCPSHPKSHSTYSAATRWISTGPAIPPPLPFKIQISYPNPNSSLSTKAAVSIAIVPASNSKGGARQSPPGSQNGTEWMGARAPPWGWAMRMYTPTLKSVTSVSSTTSAEENRSSMSVSGSDMSGVVVTSMVVVASVVVAEEEEDGDAAVVASVSVWPPFPFPLLPLPAPPPPNTPPPLPLRPPPLFLPFPMPFPLPLLPFLRWSHLLLSTSSGLRSYVTTTSSPMT